MFARSKFIYTLFIFIGLIQSCGILNKDEGQPAYIEIDNIDFLMANGDSSSSHNIVDIWVGTQEDNLGVYTLPATVPVLEYGKVVITFDAGVYFYGQTATRQKHFFYKTYVDTMDLVADQYYKVTPKIKYFSETVFSEFGSDNFEKSVKRFIGFNDQVISYEVGAEAFESVSAFMRNDDDQLKQLRMYSKNSFVIENDKTRAPVYLEFDYNTSSKLDIGITLYEDGTEEELMLMTVLPSNDKWKHMYVDLTQQVNLSNFDTEYKLFFDADTTYQGDYFGLDNVRLMYFAQ